MDVCLIRETGDLSWVAEVDFDAHSSGEKFTVMRLGRNMLWLFVEKGAYGDVLARRQQDVWVTVFD
jgi:hypothetical protein